MITPSRLLQSDMLLPAVTPLETPNSYGIFGTHKTLRRTPLRGYYGTAALHRARGSKPTPPTPNATESSREFHPLLPFELHPV